MCTMNLIKKLFKSENDKLVEKYRLETQKINSLEESISQLSDKELKSKTQELKEKLAEGKTLDDISHEAFAVVREASKRVSGERHYDVQLIGGLTIHNGNIAEMRTGEGKTLVATLPVYLNALSGKGVHVVTVNDYLARRDAVWMGQIYDFLGLSVAVINQQSSFIYDPSHSTKEDDEERDEEGSFKIVYDFLRPITRQEAYQADITYGTNSEFGFDYLRDNLEVNPNMVRQRSHSYAVVDEIDSILIDEARTPLIISAPTSESEGLYKQFAKIADTFVAGEDYEVDEKLRSVDIKDSGIEKAEKALDMQNIYTEAGMKYVHHLEKAVQAKAMYHRDKEYVVREGQIVIVDEFTGRLQPGRRWSDGLHQAIEAKEGVQIGQESKTFASITYQNYFRLYDKLAGMTGTADTSSEEFAKVYGLEVVTIPTHKPIARIDGNDLIFQTQKGKFTALAREVKSRHEKGQPVLIGTVSIEMNEVLSEFLKKEGIPHQVLNAKNHEREGEIIAQAGERGAVTIATNMAGRGVDIKLGGIPFSKEKAEEVKSLGGLYVIGTERHDARRIDNQLRGRAGRQGDPGETQFFVSMEDKLMRVFASDGVKNMMGRMGLKEDEPIQAKIISRSLENAQSRIEGMNFDARKAVLEYDSVLNTQRKSIYAKRKRVLHGDREEIDSFLKEIYPAEAPFWSIWEEKKSEIEERQIYGYMHRILLFHLDRLWVEHLETMDHARASVTLRSVGQRDPIIEYKKEGKRLFEEMNSVLLSRVQTTLEKLDMNQFVKKEEQFSQSVQKAKKAGVNKESESAPVQAISEDKPSRNDVVTIEKGGETQTLKYKKAEALLEEGWTLVR